MHFHSAKVTMNGFTILSKIFSAFCDCIDANDGKKNTKYYPYLVMHGLSGSL